MYIPNRQAVIIGALAIAALAVTAAGASYFTQAAMTPQKRHKA